MLTVYSQETKPFDSGQPDWSKHYLVIRRALLLEDDYPRIMRAYNLSEDRLYYIIRFSDAYGDDMPVDNHLKLLRKIETWKKMID